MTSKEFATKIIEGVGGLNAFERYEMLIDPGRLCNCAGCNRELLGESHEAAYVALCCAGLVPEGMPEPVGGRIQGRPFCDRCLEGRRVPDGLAGLTPRQTEKLQ